MNDLFLHANLSHANLNRRRFLQAGAVTVGCSALLLPLSLQAEQLRKEGRACVLVWLAGAPSQIETWDPKPGTANGGETKAISTSVSGVQIAEYWPKVAQLMNEAAVIRTIAGKEAAHERGTYHLHTGRRLGGPEKFPNIGSVVSHQNGDLNSDMPNFVSIGQTLSSGFLGVQYAPFIVNRPGELPANVKALVERERLERRLALLGEQENDFARAGAEALVAEHKTLYARARKLMTSPKLKAFELEQESGSVQEAYGTSTFGKGMLVARRLLEAGVPFVEVRRGGWDMHNGIFDRMESTGADVDLGLSQLITDLKQRGMLERTLVICMGEFGRTPKINARTPTPGRDHWARNFNVFLAGGGIRGGQAIGKTDANGQEIIDRAVTVEDLFQSICKIMKVDADEELFTPGGRPLRIVDGGEPIGELFG